jgi:hypothetical protein
MNAKLTASEQRNAGALDMLSAFIRQTLTPAVGVVLGSRHRLTLFLIAIVGAVVMAGGAERVHAGPFSGCPAVGLDLECRLLISVQTVDSFGKAVTFSVSENLAVAPTYDGADDTLVGIQNNSNSPLTSIMLTGVPGSNIAGFEGDGACSGGFAFSTFGNPPLASCGLSSFVGVGNVQGYQAFDVVFSNFSVLSSFGTFDSVTVTFPIPIPPLAGNGNCGSVWFSLENALAPNSLVGGIPGGSCNSIPVSKVPEPASIGMLAIGLVGLLFGASRRRKSEKNEARYD